MEFKNNSCYLMELIYIKANQWKILRTLSDFVFFYKIYKYKYVHEMKWYIFFKKKFKHKLYNKECLIIIFFRVKIWLQLKINFIQKNQIVNTIQRIRFNLKVYLSFIPQEAHRII